MTSTDDTHVGDTITNESRQLGDLLAVEPWKAPKYEAVDWNVAGGGMNLIMSDDSAEVGRRAVGQQRLCPPSQ
jgi:hypothetical protein